MDAIKEIFASIMNIKPYVLLPVILLLISLVFGRKPGKAVVSSLMIGVGFIGVFIIFDYFIRTIGPAVEALIKNTGLGFDVLDVGWPPLAAMTWSFGFVPLFVAVIAAANLAMLALKLTRTVNIDIWNYWNFIIIGALVYESTSSLALSAGAVAASSVVTVKLGDWSIPAVKKFSGVSGISITTLSGTAYFPAGILGNRLLGKVPGLCRIDADPEVIKRKLGLFGEPMVIGFVLGMLLGCCAGFRPDKVLELAFEIAAVVYILPMMCGILGKGFMSVSEGFKEYIAKKFPDRGEFYMGVDLAILAGNPSAIVTGLLLMPIALILAFLLPGISFIPLGDLANLIGAMVMVVAATGGNVVRAFIIGIPIIIGKLYVASYMAQSYVELAAKVNFKLQGYHGMFTSFLDGGNLMKFYFIELFSGKYLALLLAPCMALVFFFCKKSLLQGDCSSEEKNIIVKVGWTWRRGKVYAGCLRMVSRLKRYGII